MLESKRFKQILDKAYEVCTDEDQQVFYADIWSPHWAWYHLTYREHFRLRVVNDDLELAVCAVPYNLEHLKRVVFLRILFFHLEQFAGVQLNVGGHDLGSFVDVPVLHRLLSGVAYRCKALATADAHLPIVCMPSPICHPVFDPLLRQLIFARMKEQLVIRRHFLFSFNFISRAHSLVTDHFLQKVRHFLVINFLIFLFYVLINFPFDFNLLFKTDHCRIEKRACHNWCFRDFL